MERRRGTGLQNVDIPLARGQSFLDPTGRQTPDMYIGGRNMDVTRVGGLRMRGGLWHQNWATIAAGPIFAWHRSAGARIVHFNGAGDFTPYTESFAVAAGSLAAIGNGSFYSFCPFGQPGAELLFIGANNRFIRFDGAVVPTQPTVTIDGVAGGQAAKSLHLAVMPAENILLSAHQALAAHGLGGTGGDPSAIYYSIAGDPLGWRQENRILLRPGDGQDIRAAVTWRDYVFIFKRSAFWVFNGSSVNNRGSTILYRRPMDGGVGVHPMGQAVAAPDGVYFVAEDGIYKTTGGDAQKVSGPLDPLFHATDPSPPPGYANQIDWPAIDRAARDSDTIAYHQGRIYYTTMTVGPFVSIQRTFVYDIASGAWFMWDLGTWSGKTTVLRHSTLGELFLHNMATGAAQRARYLVHGGPQGDRDAILDSQLFSFRTPFLDFGSTEVKTLMMLEIDGEMGQASGGSGGATREIRVYVDEQSAPQVTVPFDFHKQADEGAYGNGGDIIQIPVHARGTSFSVEVALSVGGRSQLNLRSAGPIIEIMRISALVAGVAPPPIAMRTGFGV